MASSGISTGNSKIRICWSTGIFVCGTFLLLGFTVCIFWIPLVLVSLCRFSHDSGLCQTHMLTEFWSIVLKKIYIPITLSNLDEHMIYRIVFPWFVCWCELEWYKTASKFCDIENFEHSYFLLSPCWESAASCIAGVVFLAAARCYRITICSRKSIQFLVSQMVCFNCIMLDWCHHGLLYGKMAMATDSSHCTALLDNEQKQWYHFWWYALALLAFPFKYRGSAWIGVK